jgi:adenylosuccinate lyase
MDIPQAYLLADAVLGLLIDIGGGLSANPAAIRARLEQQLPFLATEEIIVAAVERGASRQEAHEVIRAHSLEVARAVREEGRLNDLLARLAADERLPLSSDELTAIAGDPSRFVGLAEEQVERYLAEVVKPRLEGYGEVLKKTVEGRVKV